MEPCRGRLRGAPAHGGAHGGAQAYARSEEARGASRSAPAITTGSSPPRDGGRRRLRSSDQRRGIGFDLRDGFNLSPPRARRASPQPRPAGLRRVCRSPLRSVSAGWHPVNRAPAVRSSKASRTAVKVHGRHLVLRGRRLHRSRFRPGRHCAWVLAPPRSRVQHLPVLTESGSR